MLCRFPLAASGAALTAVLLGGCAQPAGLHVQGDAMSPSPAAGPVHVAGTDGEPTRQPASIRLSEEVELSGLRWEDWGGPTAAATGKLRGDWCRPACDAKPYDVTVTLSGLQKQGAGAYYQRATVEPERPDSLPDAAVRVQLQRIRLAVPEF
ncbi:hypothetical protein ACX6XY_29670 [Streptomyces sp. O3]